VSKPKSKKGIWLVSIIVVIVLAVASYFIVGNSKNYVAKVGDEKITQDQLTDAMQTQYGATVLTSLITNSVINQEAKKQNVTVTTKEIDAEVDAQAEQYGGTDALESALKSSNMTMADFKDSVKTYIQTQKLMEPTLEITEAKLKAYFKENKSTYDTAKQVKASHILVEDKATATKVKKLLDNGGDFAKLAKKYSTDSSNADDGGNLGYFAKADMDENFSDAAFSMEKGEISSPVKSSYGYHIIQVTGVKAAKKATYADVKDKVREAYVTEQMNANYATWIQQLEADYKIENTLTDSSEQ
jgi:foldase protein PrsA